MSREQPSRPGRRRARARRRVLVAWVAVFAEPLRVSLHLLRAVLIRRTYQRIRFRSSTDSRRRTRKIATMIASPTATSAAATAITKKTSAWPSAVPEPLAEGHQGQVGGVQHQLDGHEDHERVAPDEHAEHAHGEEHGRERHVVGLRHHRSCELRAPVASSDARPPCAASSSTEVSSNGKQVVR